jgi:hypothetical protein
MSLTRRLLMKVADPLYPGSLGYRAREKRMAWLLERFPDFTHMRVLDLGGDTRFWRAAKVRPAHVMVVGIEEWALREPESWMDVLQADACQPDAIPSGYDLVYSNSVIEHVGGQRPRRGFARSVQQSGAHTGSRRLTDTFRLSPTLFSQGFSSCRRSRRSRSRVTGR